MNYEHWIRHFDINRQHRAEPDWETPLTISASKRAGLARTLAEYQLGDGGGECRLIGFDASRARSEHVLAGEVIDRWFSEEREHSRLLSNGLRRVGGAFLTTTFGFRWFNRIRRWFGAQSEMLVLLVVEIVSTGYYRIIQRHCDDAPLAAMCGLILRDEAGHIMFHRDRLAAKPGDWSRGVRAALIHALAAACSGFLWLSHGRWLRAIGGRWSELWSEVGLEKRLFLQRLAKRRQTPNAATNAANEQPAVATNL